MIPKYLTEGEQFRTGGRPPDEGEAMPPGSSVDLPPMLKIRGGWYKVGSTNSRTKAEIARWNDFLQNAGADPVVIGSLADIIENASWLKVKLDDTRKLIKDQGVVIEYDNGGGQNGVRENPAFKGYNALLKSYRSCLADIREALPQSEHKELEARSEVKTMLELVREKRKA